MSPTAAKSARSLSRFRSISANDSDTNAILHLLF
jgi:hypothetical protein